MISHPHRLIHPSSDRRIIFRRMTARFRSVVARFSLLRIGREEGKDASHRKGGREGENEEKGEG